LPQVRSLILFISGPPVTTVIAQALVISGDAFLNVFTLSRLLLDLRVLPEIFLGRLLRLVRLIKASVVDGGGVAEFAGKVDFSPKTACHRRQDVGTLGRLNRLTIVAALLLFSDTGLAGVNLL